MQLSQLNFLQGINQPWVGRSIDLHNSICIGKIQDDLRRKLQKLLVRHEPHSNYAKIGIVGNCLPRMGRELVFIQSWRMLA